jgi:hypothetical protein
MAISPEDEYIENLTQNIFHQLQDYIERIYLMYKSREISEECYDKSLVTYDCIKKNVNCILVSNDSFNNKCDRLEHIANKLNAI